MDIMVALILALTVDGFGLAGRVLEYLCNFVNQFYLFYPMYRCNFVNQFISFHYVPVIAMTMILSRS